ncbi:MAG: pyridoxal-phosphate dependent enzyme [Actinobacteria bacterium]|nr:MAG: pyridoxal-phosphate dependent enzyme [Actinomycetota bacterium]
MAEATSLGESHLPIGFEDVLAAEARLAGVANRTPVFTSRTLDELIGGRVFVKAESFQRGGSFKFRGAYNKISTLPSGTGVAAYSSGNHAQAVALAARLAGSPAVVLMPEDAPGTKVEATRSYGAEVVSYDRYAEDREALGKALAAERGLVLVAPYEDPLVMAGQGTAALELIREVGEVDVLVAPVGGGGLIAGTATAAAGLAPAARIVGVEPEAGDDTRRSLEAGRRVRIPVPRTIADGLQVNVPGELSFQVNRRRVDRVVTVSDRQIVEAMTFLFERMKLVAEPSGAAGLAALLSRRLDVTGARVGVILSGGNVSAERFRELLAG